MNATIDKFWELVQIAKNAWYNTSGINEIECYLLDVLRFVKRFPDDRNEFIKCFITLLHDGRSSMEIIQFCMRELQWLEIKEAATEIQRNSNDIRMKDIMERIIEVYKEKWVDEDLYDYYSHGEQSMSHCH